MILDCPVSVKIGRRNVAFYRNAIDPNFTFPKHIRTVTVMVSPYGAMKFSKQGFLNCQCENCESPYKQSITQLLDWPVRENYCPKCCFIIGQENMKKLWLHQNIEKKEALGKENFMHLKEVKKLLKNNN